MGCCFSKKNPPPPPPRSSGDGSSSLKPPPKPENPAIVKPLKPEIEAKEKLEVEETKPKKEEEEEIVENGKARKEVFVIKHRRSHEKPSKTTTDPEDSSVVSEEKSTGSNPNQNPVDVDAILIQCGRLSRSNSAAAKTRRYSGSKRSFDFDQNGGDAEEADAEDGGEEERIHRQRHRGGESSPRERRRRTPSRERENRSGSRERGGSNSRRVSRSPGRRSETNPNSNSNAGSGSSVNSSNNNKPAKFVSVPATDKSNNNGEPSVKRITVKRNIGKAPSPRSQSPARATANTQPSPSKLSRKTDLSPYRRNPLGEIDPNSLAYPPSQGNNSNNNKKMINKDNESGNFVIGQKMNAKTATQAPMRRTASPNRVTREQQETVEECKKIVLSSGSELAKPQVMSRSRSLRKSRDFDFSPEALISNINIESKNNPVVLPSYTALLLEDIQNFHQKSVNVNVNASTNAAISKACSIVEAVADLNSSTKNQQQRTTEFSFTSAAATKKADLMKPSFEKYVTVKRGGCTSLEDMDEEESSGSNSFTGSSGVVQQRSSPWEPNSAESTDRASRDRSPLGGNQEFDPLKKNGVGVGRKRIGSSC